MENIRVNAIEEPIRNSVVYEFKGVFTHARLKEIGHLITEELFTELHSKVVKKIFACSNELVQNVGFYSIERNGFIGVGKIRIISEPTFVIVETTNRVRKEAGENLVNRINSLNNMDSEELKKEYKKTISDGGNSVSKGAGIGFIEIIKRTKNKIKATFDDTSEGEGMLIISARINKED